MTTKKLPGLNVLATALLALGISAVAHASAQIAETSADLSPLKELSVVVGGKTVSILTDANGMSLYTFDPDKPGVSNCNGGCAKAWPPVAAPTQPVSAPLSVVTRQDGSKQLALNGQALYLYIRDKKSGDILGDGDDGIWHLVPAPSARAAE